MSSDHSLTLISSLRARNVRFVVIGGLAAVLYGVPRATFDVDLLVPPDGENIEQFLRTLRDLRYREVHDPDKAERLEESFICPIESITTDEILGRRSVRFRDGIDADLLVAETKTFYDFIETYKCDKVVEGTSIPLPNILDLIRIKELAGRPQDLEDVRILRHILRTQQHR